MDNEYVTVDVKVRKRWVYPSSDIMGY